MNKVFLHVDLDAFFASVEQLDHPEYRGKPVIVGGLPGDRRSVVSTASYEARRYGVHSAMPTVQAVKLCPNGIFLRGRMKRYHEKSEEVMSIFKNYSPDIQQISVDEAFIDLTGTEKLFGAPEETAKKLKAEVLEKTGLTVSVGLASTKYCAKIASGLQKPDGLTVVPFGSETEFMLSLPIEKVWGAGKKTLEKLNNYGIKTTRDIYTRSEKLLQSLFGNAAGTFLYNSVRGNAGADFHAEPKSRSISAETTFEYDLTDRNAIETALLALCHTVMFRSLREKVRSSSVSLKIRYEDFSTVSVQNTGSRYVSSVDDLFERAKALFYKKHDGRTGVRLLGVTMQNLEDENTPRQQELFDFGEEKKRRLETAILKAQEKNPSVKITKARLLGTTSLLLAILMLPVQKTTAEIATDTQKEADGAAGIVFDTSKLPLEHSDNFIRLFNADLTDSGDQKIDFYASGYWKSTVTSGAAYSFGFGSTPAFSAVSPVFAQNVDLSLRFMLNDRWYFEADFADEFTKNTIAAGFIGDGYLKSLRISNRKIVFPSIYSVDDVNRGIGGGENQAPGISMNWAGQKWRADAVLRYDMLEAHEKTWYGKNSVSINEIALSSYNTGNQYILPAAKDIQDIKEIYVESSEGKYRDSKGRKYKKLDATQYLLLASRNMILLSKDAKAGRKTGVLPAVALTFYNGVSQHDFGDYDDEGSFLGKVQKYFSRNGSRNIKLQKYSYRLSGSIDGEDCLYIQYPSGFSPFAVASRYDCGSSSAGDAQVADAYSGNAVTDYSVVLAEDDISFASTDFFYSNHLYADISSNDETDSDSMMNLIRSAFPLAGEHPEVYLGSTDSKLSGLVLQVRTFTPVNRLEIGTEAAEGTVTVYKNGVIDGTAKYDPESGTVTLSSAPSGTDHITVRWYEDSEDSDSGAVAAAGGFKYDFTKNLYGDISASTRWSTAPDKEFADKNYASQGAATLASKIVYQDENLLLANTAASTLENTNTTGNYRILGNDDTDTETSYLSKKAGINLPEGFAPVLNEKNPSGTSQIELSASKNGSVEVSEGVTDSEISGYAVPFEWDFSAFDYTEQAESSGADNTLWSAVSLYTQGISGTISNAQTFSIAVKNPAPSADFDTSKCALYLQLGVSSEDDFVTEESDVIPTWKISEAGSPQVKNFMDFSKSGWQTVTVTLSDEDRSRIASLRDFSARLILTSQDISSLPKTGTFFIGPYEAGEITFRTETDAGVTVTNYQTIDTSLSSEKIRKFNRNSKNKVQTFEWDFTETQAEAQEIKFIRNFSETSLSEYKKLSFFLKGENVESVRITLSSDKKTALDYKITNSSSAWQEYTVDLSGTTNSSLTVLDTDTLPLKLEITVTAKENGSISFDELYLSENTPYVVLQDKIKAEYKIDGAIWETESREILKDLKISSTGDAAGSIETENGNSKENALQYAGNLSFTLMNMKLGTHAKLSNAYRNTKSPDINQKNALASASHSLGTEKPLLKLLSFSEDYSFSAEESSLEKSDEAKISFSGYGLPLELSAKTKASSDSWSLSQDMEAKTSFKPGRINFSARAGAQQKVLTDSASSENGGEKLPSENYFYSWKKISDFSFDTGSEKASKRSVGAKADLSYSFDTACLTPKINFETSGNYKSGSKETFTDVTKAGFEIPFLLSKNNFSFSWKKSAGSTDSVTKGGDYGRDTSDLQESLAKKEYFFTSLPVYDLASGNLAAKVYETDRESSYYTGAYSFNWKRAFSASRYDFFIPVSAKLEATRDIRTGDSTSDFYQIKGTANYTALNIFGRSGTMPIFSFFSNDEYSSSLTAAVKIPRNEPDSFSYLVSGYVQATFYFTPKNYLRNGFEGSVEGKDDWKAKYTLVWKRNAGSSLARGAVSIFSEEKAEKVQKITKTDSFNAGASCASSTSKNTRRYSLAYMHEVETQVSKYISLNTDAGASYQALWGKSATLTATATVGATIRF